MTQIFTDLAVNRNFNRCTYEIPDALDRRYRVLSVFAEVQTDGTVAQRAAFLQIVRGGILAESGRVCEVYPAATEIGANSTMRWSWSQTGAEVTNTVTGGQTEASVPMGPCELMGGDEINLLLDIQTGDVVQSAIAVLDVWP